MDVSFLLVLLGGKKISLVFLFLLILLVLYKHHLPPSSVHACILSHFSHVQFFVTLWAAVLSRLLCPGNFPGKNTGVGCQALLQGIFQPRDRTYVSCLPHGQAGSFTTSATWWVSIKCQVRSVTQSCLTLCDPMNHRTPGLPIHHQLPEFTQTHVHRVSDAIQPSHLLSSPSPPAPNPSQHQSLFQWLFNSSTLHMRWPSSVSLSKSFFIYFLPFNWIWFAPNRASLSAFFLEGFLPLGWKWWGRRLIFSRLPIADFMWRVHTLHSSMRLQALQELDCILLMAQHSTLGWGRGGFHHQYTISRCVLSDWTCLTNYLNPSLINPKDRLDLELSVNYREVQY